jgi:sugar phosphate isomerase/epimerase
MHINGAFANTPALIADAGALLSHVHVSEPQLAPAPADAAQAASVLRALDGAGYGGAVSIEMKAAPDTPVERMAAAVGRLQDARHLADAKGSL